MRQKALATAIVMLLVVAIVVPEAGAPAGAPSLTVAPSAAHAGSSITLTGRGFAARARLILVLDGAAQLATLRADGSGGFATSLVLAAATPAGRHRVDAMALNSLAKARRLGLALASVTVVVLATSQPPLGPTPTTNPAVSGPPDVGSSAPPSVGGSPSPTATPGSPPTGGPTPPIGPTPVPPTPVPPTPAPPPPAPTSWQPPLPVRAAFYYPWFPEAWKQQGMDPFTKYHPSLGFYDSGAASTITQHLSAMQYGGIEVGISSWWGPDTRSDSRVPALLANTAGSSFRWTLYYEQEAQGDPTVDQIASDLRYIRDRYASDATFFKVGGRFVLFVYTDGADACSMAARWSQANVGINAYLVLKVFSGFKSCPAQPAGWHQYAPAKATDGQPGFSYAISPGFDKANEAAPRLARDVTRWAQNVRDMIASAAPFQLVTTFNEWGEGTSVESATEWSSGSGFGSYLDVLHANGQ